VYILHLFSVLIQFKDLISENRKLIERYTYHESKKSNKKQTIYHRTSFCSILDMSPKIQNDLPKITKIKWICYFSTNSGQISL